MRSLLLGPGLAALLAACASAPRVAAVPAPQPEPVAEAPAPLPEKADEDFAIERLPNQTVGGELLGSAHYDLPLEANQWVAAELNFLVGERHDVVGRWMERADRFSAFVQETFAAAGIPRDLHHLAMVESGYLPTARSRAGAVGMWQFMSGTGRGMGLRIDDGVDERMDPVRSTRAAARHLRQLWGDFGRDWALAAAAYNAGGGRISRGMSRYAATSFWDLAERGDLARETRRYVPRLYAVTIIAHDPQRFGYRPPLGAVRPLAFDSVWLDLSTPLSILAQAGGVSLAELGELNPHLYRGVAPSRYWVWVPRGTAPALQQGMAASEFVRRGGFAWYALRRGESAASVAAAAGLSLEQLRDLNQGVSLSGLGRGDRLRLFADASRRLAQSAPAVDADEAAPRLAGVPADSAAAERAPSDLVSGLVRARMVIAPSARPAREEARSAEAASEAERPQPRARTSRQTRASREPESSRRVRYHTVEAGETLYQIARRNDLTVAQLSAANRLDPDEALQPGQRLRIPAGGEPQRHAERPRREARSSVRRHVVKDGESLWSIARSYDTTVAALGEANQLSASAVLQPGQTLRIPRRTRDER